jgi:serine/threonine protein kinase
VKVLSFLGKGSYGSVYRAELNGRPVAFKVEKPGSSQGCFVGKAFAPPNYLKIEHEVRVLRYMRGVPGFPKVRTFNFVGSHKYYVMDLFDKSLSGLRKEQAAKRLVTGQLIRLAHQMLDRIESLHKRGLLMYDIHQGNFMLRGPDLYVIDPGMALPFYNDQLQHLPQVKSPVTASCKNSHYATRNDMAGRSVSRRDDLERLIYLLVELNTGRLPWSDEKDWDRIRVLKGRPPSTICTGDAAWLEPALTYVYSLQFDQEPYYGILRSAFNRELDRLHDAKQLKPLRKSMR